MRTITKELPHSNTMTANTLVAEYTSPTAQQTFSSNLPSLAQEQRSVKDKTAYLSALRANVTQLQSDVNTFLTQKMEEDKAAEAGKADQKAKSKEEREEAMYGEEDVEEEG